MALSTHTTGSYSILCQSEWLLTGYSDGRAILNTGMYTFLPSYSIRLWWDGGQEASVDFQDIYSSKKLAANYKHVTSFPLIFLAEWRRREAISLRLHFPQTFLTQNLKNFSFDHYISSDFRRIIPDIVPLYLPDWREMCLHTAMSNNFEVAYRKLKKNHTAALA